jgi:hypothetical protein
MISNGDYMLPSAFHRLKPDSKLKPGSTAPTTIEAPPGGLSRMVTSSGRISLTILERMIQALSPEDFIRYMQEPAMVGSAVHLGTLSATRLNSGSREMNRTILFEPVEDAEESSSASESLKTAIYPLVRGEFATSTGCTFTIGRIDGNDLIMPDYAISKRHAIIDVRRGSYMLKDCGSTNGTTLNGERIQSKPMELHDRDIISFARYEFSFVFPGSLYDMIRTR